MIDLKSMMNQVQDLQVVLHDILTEGMALSETFQVVDMIKKLPPSWIDFKNYHDISERRLYIGYYGASLN